MPTEPVRVHIPEHVIADKRLGRHVLHDPRSRDYEAPMAPTVVSVAHAARGLPLNQGQIGSCTANALCGARNSDPEHRSADKLLTETDAKRLYHDETVLEGEPWPPNDPGGTGLMVCKAAANEGLITSYSHAFGVEHALRSLVLRPVIIGVNWYSSMDEPDPATGMVSITPDAYVRGGHEIVVDSIDAANKTIGLWNSWGRSWGLGGKFNMAWDTLDRLLHEQGDATVAVR